MKKLICLMIAAMLAISGVCCFAEGKDEDEKTSFLQIRENITAQVFEAPGDGEGIDTLESGRFCGLIEETVHEEEVWFHVFYLKSEKKGATGYIRTDDADQLTWKDLKEIMEDSKKVNEILDLIDALNDYLNQMKGNTASAEQKKNGAEEKGAAENGAKENGAADNGAAENGAAENGSAENGSAENGAEEKKTDENGNGAGEKSQMEQFYTDAMDMLKQLYNMNISAELARTARARRETMEKLAAAGKDMLGALAEGAADLFNKAKDAGKETAEKILEDAKELFSEAGEVLKKEIEDKAPDVEEKLEKLADSASDAIGSSKEKLEELADKASDAIGSSKEKLEELADNVSDAADSVKKKVGEIADNVSDAAKSLTDGSAKEMIDDLVQDISDQVKDLTDDLSEKIKDLTDESGKEQMEELLDKVTDTVDSLKDASGDAIRELEDHTGKAMDQLDQFLGNSVGDALDKLSGLADEARELMGSMEFSMAQSAVGSLAEVFRTEGFSQGAQTTSQMIELLSVLGGQ